MMFPLLTIMGMRPLRWRRNAFQMAFLCLFTYYNNIQLYCNGVFGRIFCGMPPKGRLAAGVGNLFEGRLKNGFSDGLIRD
jgi:hypothetical protein